MPKNVPEYPFECIKIHEAEKAAMNTVFYLETSRTSNASPLCFVRCYVHVVADRLRQFSDILINAVAAVV